MRREMFQNRAKQTMLRSHFTMRKASQDVTLAMLNPYTFVRAASVVVTRAPTLWNPDFASLGMGSGQTRTWEQWDYAFACSQLTATAVYDRRGF